MAYFAPFMDSTGLHTCTYQDIEDLYVQSAKSIFGQDIYLGNDSQDFQFQAIVARSAYNTQQALHLDYNNRSPLSAVGIGLDGVVSCNGIRRKPATKSTVTLQLTGTPFTQITNGFVSDVNGNYWDLPVSVTLSSEGTASITASCRVVGPINAAPGQINLIQTPTSGWQTVTNPQAAIPGQNVESDSELRARQAISVENPSQALTGGILGGVRAVPNVDDAVLYENDTDVTKFEINGSVNPGGFPEHSITMVIDGGDPVAIASAIELRKTPGCYTNGDQEYDVIDSDGIVTTIRFFRPTIVYFDVSVTLKALPGFTSSTEAAILNAILNLINGGQIGQTLINSEIWQAILNVDTNARPIFSVREVLAGYHGSGQILTNEDLPLDFDQRSATLVPYITITVT